MSTHSNYAPRENNRSFHPQHKPTWTVVQTLKRGELALEIEKSDHHPFPRYRFRLGRPYEFEGNSRLGAIQPRIDGYKMGVVSLDSSFADAKALLSEGEEWVLQEAGSVAASYNDHIVNRDRGFVPEHRRTGKTDRERERRRNRG